MGLFSTIADTIVSLLIEHGEILIDETKKQNAISALIGETVLRASSVPSSVSLTERFSNPHLIEELLAHRKRLDVKRHEAIHLFLGDDSDGAAYEFVEKFCDSVDEILSTGEESLVGRKTLEGVDVANRKLDEVLQRLPNDAIADWELQKDAVVHYCEMLAHHHEDDIIPRSLAWLDSKVELNQSDFINSGRSVLVYADPGMGKSELMRSVAADLARRWVNDDGKTIPVLLDAKGWSRRYASMIEGICRAIFGQATKHNELFIQNNLSHFCLIIDGLDEARVDRDLLFSELAHYAKNSEVRMICSSRFEEDCSRIGIDGATLLGLSDNDILAYLNGNAIDSPWNVIRRLTEHGHELMRNPLYLKCLVEYIHDKGTEEAPRNLAAILKSCVSAMVGSKVDPNGNLDADYLKQQLGYYALECLTGQGAISCRGFFMKRFGSDEASRIEEAGKASGLLVVVGGVVEFAHAVFQEYLAALYLSGCDSLTIRFYCEHYSDNLLLKHFFKLLCGSTDNPEKQALILDCLEESNLSLFMDCLRGRMNLSDQLESRLSKKNIEAIIQQALKTYTDITNRYLIKTKPYIPFWRTLSKPDAPIRIEAVYSAATTVIHLTLKEKKPGEDSVLVRFSDDEQGPVMIGPKGDVIPLLSLRVSNRPEVHTYRIAELYGGLDCAREIAISMINDDLEGFFQSPQTVVCEPIGMRAGFVEEAIRRSGITQEDGKGGKRPLSLRTCTAAELSQLLEGKSESFITVGDMTFSIGVLPYLVRMFEIKPEDHLRYLPPDPVLIDKGSCGFRGAYANGAFEEWCKIALSECEKSYRQFVQMFMEELGAYLPSYADGPFALHVAIESGDCGKEVSDRRLEISIVPVESEGDIETVIDDDSFSREFDPARLDEHLRVYRRQANLFGRSGASFSEKCVIGSSLLRERSFVDKEVRKRLRNEVKLLFKLN